MISYGYPVYPAAWSGILAPHAVSSQHAFLPLTLSHVICPGTS